MRTEKPVGFTEMKVDADLKDRVEALERDHNIVIAEYVDLFGPGSNGLALRWTDIDAPAILIAMKNHSTKEAAVKHLIKAWDASQPMIDELRQASLENTMVQAAGETKQ